jgi:hypothetical protein
VSDEDRVALRRAQASLRAMAVALTRRGEYAKARRVRRAQIALNRDWRPGMDVAGRLAALRDTLRVEL